MRVLLCAEGAGDVGARIAAREGFDAVVFLADADSPDPAVWRTRHAQVREGFREAGVPIACLACVPKSMAESWLLADGAAWHALGLPERVPLPRDPETLWGPKRDPRGDHPKALFARLCTEAGCAPGRETHNALAGRIDLEVLARACALSHGAFARDLRGGLPVTPPAADG